MNNPEYVFNDPPPPFDQTNPTAALSSLHYHLAATGILNLLREAWDKADDEAKGRFAQQILLWAGNHLDQLRVTDLMTHWLGKLVADGKFVLPPEDEAELVQVLYRRISSLLKERGGWEAEKVREALIEAAKQRLADVQAEFTAAALAREPGDS